MDAQGELVLRLGLRQFHHREIEGIELRNFPRPTRGGQEEGTGEKGASKRQKTSTPTGNERTGPYQI